MSALQEFDENIAIVRWLNKGSVLISVRTLHTYSPVKTNFRYIADSLTEWQTDDGLDFCEIRTRTYVCFCQRQLQTNAAAPGCITSS